MRTFPREKGSNARHRRMRNIPSAVLAERKTLRIRKNNVDDTQTLSELRSLIDCTGASVPVFARFAGLAPRTVYSYLAGKRPVPTVAVAAGRYASLVLGKPVKMRGAEIMLNLGFSKLSSTTKR